MGLNPVQLKTKIGTVKDTVQKLVQFDSRRQHRPIRMKHEVSEFCFRLLQVYDLALQLWDSRCREVLPPEQHAELCVVRR